MRCRKPLSDTLAICEGRVPIPNAVLEAILKATFSALDNRTKVALLASASIVIAVFLPWVSVFGISVSGISTGDGKLVLLVAGAALVVLATRTRLVQWFDVSQRATDIASLAAALLCLLVAIADMSDFAAFGLYVTLLASIAWTAAAALTLFRPSRVEEPAEAPNTNDVLPTGRSDSTD